MTAVGRRVRAIGPVAAALVAAVLVCGCAFATPSGLNNIPTADVVPADVLVLQAFSQFGEDRAPAWFAGLKYGAAENWEVGVDDTAAGPGSAGGPVLQAKYRLQLNGAATAALGAANISDDRERNGEVFPYAAVSGDMGAARGHLGRSWQKNNHAWFVGLDAPVSPKLTLRADWIQVQEGEESVTGLGFIASVGPRWLVEGWASFPTEEAAGTDCILKLDWVIPFGQ